MDLVRRCRYGENALWTVCGDLTGTRARRFASRVALHFRSENAPLLVDLRGAGLIDSTGAAALRELREQHPAFGLVGRPASWVDLPALVRGALRALDPAPSLERALTPVSPTASPAGAEKRRHPRIALQVPIEVVCGGRAAPGSLRDISQGGLRLGLLPEGWLGRQRRAGAASTLTIIGLDDDPLGRELTARFGAGPVTAVPVFAIPGGQLGARFADSHPPV